MDYAQVAKSKELGAVSMIEFRKCIFCSRLLGINKPAVISDYDELIMFLQVNLVLSNLASRQRL
jgi:hypothetical protein